MGTGFPTTGRTGGGLGLDAFSRTGDYDHDGDSDLREYGSDTCPMNAQDYLAIRAVAIATNTAHVTFGSSTSRVYALQSVTNLTAGSWAGVPGQTNRAGQAGGQMTLVDTNPAPIRIYRIRVDVP